MVVSSNVRALCLYTLVVSLSNHEPDWCLYALVVSLSNQEPDCSSSFDKLRTSGVHKRSSS